MINDDLGIAIKHGMESHGSRVVLAIDSAVPTLVASISRLMLDVRETLKQTPDFELHLFGFGASITRYAVVRPHSINDLLLYTVPNNRGSDIRLCWDLIRKSGIAPCTALIYTDGRLQNAGAVPAAVKPILVLGPFAQWTMPRDLPFKGCQTVYTGYNVPPNTSSS